MVVSPDMFKISIITITYNSEEHLEQTIQSVAAQTYSNIEHIVIDGGSTDGTLDIIKRHEQHLDYWASEPDDGIADAMNKGIALASGDFVYFLHSDDYLGSNDAISKACGYLTRKDDVFLFNIYLEKAGKRKLHRPRGFNAWLQFKTGVYHQSAICSKRLFQEIGLFDTDFRIAMDHDFFLRAYKRGITAVKVDLPLGTMRMTGVSSQTDWPSLKRRFLEERRVQLKNCETVGMRLLYEVFWVLYWPYRRLRSMASMDG